MLSAAPQINLTEPDGYDLIQRFYKAISYDDSLPKPVLDQLEQIRIKYYNYLNKIFNTQNFVSGTQENILLIRINKLIRENFFQNKIGIPSLQILINDIKSNGVYLRNEFISSEIREDILDHIRTINSNFPNDEIQSIIGAMSNLSLSSGNSPLNGELTRILNEGNNYLYRQDWQSAIQSYALGISTISNTAHARLLYIKFELEFIKLSAIAHQNHALSLIVRDEEICLDSFFKVILTLTSITSENLNVDNINIIKTSANEYMMHSVYFANKRQGAHDYELAIVILKTAISNIDQIKKKFNFIDAAYIEKVIIDTYLSYQDYLQTRECFANCIPILRQAMIVNNKLIVKFNDTESITLASLLKYNLMAAIANASNRICIQGNILRAVELFYEAIREMKNYQITAHLADFDNNFTSICTQLSMIFNNNFNTISEAELLNSIVFLKECIPTLALLIRYKAVRALIDVIELYAYKLQAKGDFKACHEWLHSAEADFIAIPAEFASGSDIMRLSLLHRHIAMTYMQEYSLTACDFTVQTAHLAEQAYTYFKKIPFEFRSEQDFNKMQGCLNYRASQMYMDAMEYYQRFNFKLAIDKFCLIVDFMNIALADRVETDVSIRSQVYQGLRTALQTHTALCMQQRKLNDLNAVCHTLKDSIDPYIQSNYHRSIASTNYLKSILSEESNSFYKAIIMLQAAIISMGEIQLSATENEDLMSRDLYLRNLIRLTVQEFQKNIPTGSNFNELQVNYLAIAVTSTYKMKDPTVADNLMLSANVGMYNSLITEFQFALVTALNELLNAYTTQSLTFYNRRVSIPFVTLGLLTQLRNNITIDSLTKARNAINSHLSQNASDPDSRFSNLGIAVDKLLILLKPSMVEEALSAVVFSEASKAQYPGMRPN